MQGDGPPEPEEGGDAIARLGDGSSATATIAHNAYVTAVLQLSDAGTPGPAKVVAIRQLEQFAATLIAAREQYSVPDHDLFDAWQAKLSKLLPTK